MFAITLFRQCTLIITSKCVVRNFSRTITGDKITPLCDTFQGRLLAYLANKSNCALTMHQLDLTTILKKPDAFQVLTNAHRNVIPNTFMQVNSLRGLSVREISELLLTLNGLDVTTKRTKILHILTLIDVECCLRLNGLKTSDILEILNGFVSIYPNRILENRFYQNAIDTVSNRIPKATPEELIELMFYVSLGKQSSKHQALMRQCVNKINTRILNSLSLTDLCIVCDSVYKTGIKINSSRIVRKLKQVLHNNLAVMSDSSLFVSILKTLKLNHCQDEDLLSTISCVIFFNKTYKYYSFATICHVLALYADYNYYDEKLMEFFGKRSLDFIADDNGNKPKNAHLNEQIRIKDLHRFLWIFSSLGYTKFTKSDFEHIIYPAIMKRVSRGDCNDNPDLLINLSLCLWMLGFRAVDLIKITLTDKNLNKLKGFGRTAIGRSNLLLSSICIEDEKLYRDLNLRSMFSINEYDESEEIQRRPILRQVYQIIQKVGPEYGLKSFKIHGQVMNLNIVGITAIHPKTKKTVQIEVLDEECCVRNVNCLPIGLMLLKLRILNYQKDPLIVVTPEDAELMNASDVEELLHSELKLYFDPSEEEETN